MADEKWIVAKETVVEIGQGKVVLGYTVLSWPEPPFKSFEEASAYIKRFELPVGWVAMKADQRPWDILFPQRNSAT